jgi:hypothetical protein
MEDADLSGAGPLQLSPHANDEDGCLIGMHRLVNKSQWSLGRMLEEELAADAARALLRRVRPGSGTSALSGNPSPAGGDE